MLHAMMTKSTKWCNRRTFFFICLDLSHSFYLVIRFSPSTNCLNIETKLSSVFLIASSNARAVEWKAVCFLSFYQYLVQCSPLWAHHILRSTMQLSCHLLFKCSIQLSVLELMRKETSLDILFVHFTIAELESDSLCSKSYVCTLHSVESKQT